MLNKRPSKLWAPLGLLVLGGLVWWLAGIHHVQCKSTYEGKPLAYWFNQLPMTKSLPGQDVYQSPRKRARHIKSGAVQEYGTWVEDGEASAKAIRAIGTDGLDFYFSKLKREESPLQNKVRYKKQ